MKKLRVRLSQIFINNKHVGYVSNKQVKRANGEPFNRPGHGLENIKFTVFKKVKSSDPLYGREREKLLIRKFNIFYC